MKEKHIRVDLSSEWYGEERGRLEPTKVVLDMLRYSGLLESNVPGFPRTFEYTVPHDASGIIARWKSFGIKAEEIDEEDELPLGARRKPVADLDETELATVLAGLRLLQKHFYEGPSLPANVQEILTAVPHGLGAEDIDDLVTHLDRDEGETVR